MELYRYGWAAWVWRAMILLVAQSAGLGNISAKAACHRSIGKVWFMKPLKIELDLRKKLNGRLVHSLGRHVAAR